MLNRPGEQFYTIWQPISAYGFAIAYFRLAQVPEIATALFILVGLAGLLSPLLTISRASRGAAYLIIAILVVAVVIALFLGINSAFAHIPGWAKWSPWYGKVVVGG